MIEKAESYAQLTRHYLFRYRHLQLGLAPTTCFQMTGLVAQATHMVAVWALELLVIHLSAAITNHKPSEFLHNLGWLEIMQAVSQVVPAVSNVGILQTQLHKRSKSVVCLHQFSTSVHVPRLVHEIRCLSHLQWREVVHAHLA